MEETVADDKKKILVVGGGIAGITAALEATEVGNDVILIERNPYLGGRVAQMYRYFPKLCPPSCGLEINYRRIRGNPRLEVYTKAEVTAVSGQDGDFEVQVEIQPRYVNDKCTACGKCAEACELEVDNPFNYNMNKMKAAYLPHSTAYPARYALHPDLVADADAAKKVADACEYSAIDLDDKARTETFKVAAVVWATGWDPFDPKVVEYYGAGKLPDVINNVMLERLAAPEGPTGGKILKADGNAPSHVVFVQCAGSRDEHHLAYCSGVCCLASLKQATYVREQLPETKVTICFIDIRTPDRLEDFYTTVQADEGVSFIRSKIADIAAKEGGGLLLNGEDTVAGKRLQIEADMVVLATGLVPNKPGEIETDDYGFALPVMGGGQYPAGCVMKPTEVSSTVQDGTAAALLAIQSVNGMGR
jgi:quinone-modifying oxidoreductase subunit QmoA